MYIYTMQHSGYGSDEPRLLPMLTNSASYWQEIFLENLKKMILNLLIDLLGIISNNISQNEGSRKRRNVTR
jgi:hypothetical protein